MAEPPDAQATPGQAKPVYEPPRIVAYDQDELLNRIGPAVACARWDTLGRKEEPEPQYEDW